MRDVTLYEDDDDERLWPERVNDRQRAVPAVVGITVAEIEESKAECREALERMERAVRDRDEARGERDEARAERDNVSVEAHHWMGQAARYREALERITALDGQPDDVWADRADEIARGALNG